MPENRPSSIVISITFLSFVLLGVSTSLLGIAWPSIRGEYGLRLEDAGILLIATTIGYTLSSLISGNTATRLGTGLSLMLANLTIIFGLTAITFSPTWPMMVAFSFVVGLGNGMIDAVTNIFLAARIRPGLMSWLHASFGVGATIGPLLVTVSLQNGLPWRFPYGVTAVGQGLVLTLMLLTFRQWSAINRPKADSIAQMAKRAVLPWKTLGLGSAWLYILIFFVHGGIEGSAGQWSYSLFTQARGVQPILAGAWVSLYWGSFTVARFLLGLVRIHPVKVVRAATLLLLIGAALFWWNPINWIGFLGLAMLGLSLAPLFPNLVSNTPHFVGEEHAANAIGFQVASASVSVGLLPSLAGVLASVGGLETLGPFLLVQSALVLVLHERTVSIQSRRLAQSTAIPEGSIHPRG
jgi:fucose permease